MTDDTTWCDLCGAYADVFAVGLARRCPGKHTCAGEEQHLRRLRRGRHPATNVPFRGRAIPEPSVRTPARPQAPSLERPQQRWGSNQLDAIQPDLNLQPGRAQVTRIAAAIARPPPAATATRSPPAARSSDNGPTRATRRATRTTRSCTTPAPTPATTTTGYEDQERGDGSSEARQRLELLRNRVRARERGTDGPENGQAAQLAQMGPNAANAAPAEGDTDGGNERSVRQRITADPSASAAIVARTVERPVIDSSAAGSDDSRDALLRRLRAQQAEPQTESGDVKRRKLAVSGNEDARACADTLSGTRYSQKRRHGDDGGRAAVRRRLAIEAGSASAQARIAMDGHKRRRVEEVQNDEAGSRAAAPSNAAANERRGETDKDAALHRVSGTESLVSPSGQHALSAFVHDDMSHVARARGRGVHVAVPHAASGPQPRADVSRPCEALRRLVMSVPRSRNVSPPRTVQHAPSSHDSEPSESVSRSVSCDHTAVAPLPCVSHGIGEARAASRSRTLPPQHATQKFPGGDG